MKKVIILVTVFMLLLISVMPIVSADETDVLSDGYIEINAVNFVSSSEGIQIDANRKVCFKDGKWAEYEVTVPADGEYYLYIYSSTNAGQDSNLSVNVNGEEQFVRKVAQTANLSSARVNYLGAMTLSEGKNTVKIVPLDKLSYVEKLYIADMPMLVRAEGENVFKAVNFSGAAASQRNEGGYAVMHGSSSSGWYEFTLYAEKAGKADLSISVGGTTNIQVLATVNEKTGNTTLLEASGSYSTIKKNKIGRIELIEGINTVRVEILSGGCYFDELFIEYLKPIEITEALALYEYDISSGEIPRETDCITVKFSKEVLADSVSGESVKLLKGNTPVKAEVSSDGNAVTVSLKETLDYGESYSLVINGVADTEDFSSVKDVKYDFVTKAEASSINNSYVSVNEADMVYEEVMINGTIYSSKDIPISGRKVFVSVLSPTSTEVEVETEEIYSDEEGNFEVLCALPEGSAYGVYTFNLTCEHGKDAYKVQLFYVSQSLEADILSGFNNVSDGDTAESLLSEYEEELDIDLDADLYGITPDDVYKQFIGQSHSTVYELRSYYYAAVAMCKLRAVGVPAQAETVLTEENCKYLGIEYRKLELIENNKTNLYTSIIMLDRNTKLPEFKAELSECIENYLMTEYGKAETELVLSDKDIYISQSVEISLAFSEAVSDAYEVILEISSDSADFFDSISVVTKEEGWQINELTDGVEIITAAPATDGKTLGKIFMTGFEEKGTYTLSVRGKVYYDVGIDFPVVSPVKTGTVKIDVSQKTQSAGTSGGKDSSVQSSGTSGGKSVITTPTPADDVETEFSFVDLGNSKWAENDIYALLELGAVAESEDKCFYPENNVKRSEFVKMLVIALGINDEEAKADFADVSEDKWYYSAVAAAQKNGLILGDENGCFNPDSYITRENIAVIMARVYENSGYTFEIAGERNIFADDDMIADYAKDSVYNMQSIGVINGMGDNIFAPKESATRAQTAKMIYRTVSEVRAW